VGALPIEADVAGYVKALVAQNGAVADADLVARLRGFHEGRTYFEAFAATLRAAGIETTIRRNRGQEVGAACGQLAAERAGEPPAPAVARRRARLVAESAAALLGERSHEPVPAGVGD
jgi:hypothetical protein